MTASAPPNLDTAVPGGLDHGRLMRLLGYNLAQATIPSFKVYEREIGQPLKLRQVEFSILVLLASNADVTQKKLSLALNVPAPNLTVILDRMQQRELLERTRSTTDRRVQYVSLARKGSALLRRAEGAAANMEKDLLRHLSSAEQGILFELLKKVAVHRRV